MTPNFSNPAHPVNVAVRTSLYGSHYGEYRSSTAAKEWRDSDLIGYCFITCFSTVILTTLFLSMAGWRRVKPSLTGKLKRMRAFDAAHKKGHDMPVYLAEEVDAKLKELDEKYGDGLVSKIMNS